MILNNFPVTAGSSIPGQKNTMSYSDIEQSLLNTPYADLVKSNPYKDFDYRESPWQVFLSSLGFRTNADAYRESMDLQSKEYISQIAQKAYNEQYESPIAEAGRARAAGFNPDLTGVEGVSGASNMPEDGNPPVAPESDEGTVLQFANVMMSALTTAIGLGKEWQSLVSLGLANRGAEITNVEKVSQFSNWIAHTFYNQPEIWNGAAYDMTTGEELSGRLADTIDKFDMYEKHIPKKYRKLFERTLASSMFSFDTSNESYRKAVEYLNNKRQYNIERGRASFKWGLGDESIRAVVQPLSELADKVEKTRLEFESKKNEYDTKFYDTEKGGLNPVIQATSQNRIAEESGLSARFEKEINDCYRSIIHKLKDAADKGDFMANIIMYSMTIQRLASDFSASMMNKASGALGIAKML